MTGLRRRLSWIACLWLCSQLAVIAATPVALFANAPDAADAVMCTCIHGPDAQCPMHHPAKSPSGCNCRNNSPDPAAAGIISMLGAVAVLTGPPVQLAPPAVTTSAAHSITRFTSIVASPDGPPPRA